MTAEFLPFCFLPLNKPVGPTSHDMVAIVRRLLPKGVKVGHTGTLDPFASGVMILAVGKATRFADDVHLLDKRYRAEIFLGRRTDTLDNTGTTDLEMPVPEVTEDHLADLAASFLGGQDQMPPAYSAKRVKGVKSYALARQNKAVALAAKRITISALSLERTAPDLLDCQVTCSTGTYIRALARDLAEALGTCGHLTSLVRTHVGHVRVEDCADPDDLSTETLPQYALPVAQLLPDFPEIQLPDEALTHCLQGRAFEVDEPLPPSFLGTFADNGRARAIFRCEYQQGSVHPRMRCYLREM